MPGIQNNKSTLSFLNTIGSTDRGDDVKLSNTAKAIVELADFVITKATANMEKSGSVATGEIISSMNLGPLNIKGTKVSIDVNIDSAYKFTDKGVKGVLSGKSYANYSFKTIRPSKNMARAILSWLKNRSIRGRTKYKAVSKNEAKNKRIHKALSEAKSWEAMSYAVATNIKKRGIKPTQFFTSAVKDMERLAKKKIGEGMKLDIIESIKNR